MGTWSWAGLTGPRPEHPLGRQGPVHRASLLQTSRKAPTVQEVIPRRQAGQAHGSGPPLLASAPIVS